MSHPYLNPYKSQRKRNPYYKRSGYRYSTSSSNSSSGGCFKYILILIVLGGLMLLNNARFAKPIEVVNNPTYVYYDRYDASTVDGRDNYERHASSHVGTPNGKAVQVDSKIAEMEGAESYIQSLQITAILGGDTSTGTQYSESYSVGGAKLINTETAISGGIFSGVNKNQVSEKLTLTLDGECVALQNEKEWFDTIAASDFEETFDCDGNKLFETNELSNRVGSENSSLSRNGTHYQFPSGDMYYSENDSALFGSDCWYNTNDTVFRDDQSEEPVKLESIGCIEPIDAGTAWNIKDANGVIVGQVHYTHNAGTGALLFELYLDGQDITLRGQVRSKCSGLDQVMGIIAAFGKGSHDCTTIEIKRGINTRATYDELVMFDYVLALMPNVVNVNSEIGHLEAAIDAMLVADNPTAHNALGIISEEDPEDVQDAIQVIFQQIPLTGR